MPPVVLLGKGFTAIGALRSLARAGIPTLAVCPRDDPICSSRWYRPPAQSRWDGSIDGNALKHLHGLNLEEMVVFPTNDHTALWLSDGIPQHLADRWRVCSSSRSTLEKLQDKGEFARMLQTSAMPHARTFVIQSHQDIDRIPFGSLDRVFVKPTNSRLFNKLLGVKGVWATSASQFHCVWERCDGMGLSVVAQEYIPGRSDQHYFIDGFRTRDGTITGLFARRRWRIYPADFGNSSYCESIPLSDMSDAVPGLMQLLEQLAYRGIFSAEFKRDERNGKLTIVEINTRAWWYVDFAARCGINVCEMAYQDALDLPVTTGRKDYPEGVGCMNFPNDARAVHAEGGVRGFLAHGLQWARAVPHVWRWSDPWPSLRSLRRWISSRFRIRVLGPVRARFG